MSKTKSLHHIVFATKSRKCSILSEHKKELYMYIYGIIKNQKCFVHRINGVEDHIHILLDLHPTVALASLVQQIKQWSSHWMKSTAKFPTFDGWCDGYYAYSLSVKELENCKNYIINQDIHHRGVDSLVEFRSLADENDLEWYADDWK